MDELELRSDVERKCPVVNTDGQMDTERTFPMPLPLLRK